MTKLLSLLTVLLLTVTKGRTQPTGSPEEECCEEKIVGGIKYINIGTDNSGIAMEMDCLSNCIFMKEGAPESKYCFAKGSLEVECVGLSTSEITPRPSPSGGGETTPVSGGETTAPEGTTTPASTCQCGVKGAKRIVGGTEANPGEWPWIVVHNFGSTDGSKPGGCGGTLVASNWIITAAHCFFDQDGNQVDFANTISMVIGEHDIRTANDPNDGKRKNLEIEELIIHENYDYKTQKNDMALLKLKENLDVSVYMPACLPAKGKDWTGQTGWVYGWGSLYHGTNIFPSVLRETFQTIITDEVCEQGSGMVNKTDPNTGLSLNILQEMSMQGLLSKDDMFCAEKSGQDSCQGDSGGPFTVEVDGKHFLAGVVSWGLGCAANGLAGVYSDVSFARGWIDDEVAAHGGATFCP